MKTLNRSEQCKRAWKTRRKLFGDSGISPEGLKKLKIGSRQNHSKNVRLRKDGTPDKRFKQ